MRKTLLFLLLLCGSAFGQVDGELLVKSSAERALGQPATQAGVHRFCKDDITNDLYIGEGSAGGFTTWTKVQTSSALEADTDADLRLLPATTIGQTVTLKGHAVAGDHAAITMVDVGTGGTDDGGATLVSTAGRTYELSRSHGLFPQYYGAEITASDTSAELATKDNAAELQAWSNAAATRKWRSIIGPGFIRAESTIDIEQRSSIHECYGQIYNPIAYDGRGVRIYSNGNAYQQTASEPLRINVWHGRTNPQNASWVGKDYAATWEPGVVNGSGEEVHETLLAETHVGLQLDGVKDAWIRCEVQGYLNNIQLGGLTNAPNNYCAWNRIEVLTSELSKFPVVLAARDGANNWCNQNTIITGSLLRGAATAGQSVYGVSLVHDGTASAGSLSGNRIDTGGIEATLTPGDEIVQMFFHGGENCRGLVRTDSPTGHKTAVFYPHAVRVDNARDNVVETERLGSQIDNWVNNGYANFVNLTGTTPSVNAFEDYSDLYSRTFYSEGSLSGQTQASIRGLRFTPTAENVTSNVGAAGVKAQSSDKTVDVHFSDRLAQIVYPNVRSDRHGILQVDVRTKNETDVRIVVYPKDENGDAITSGTQPDGLETMTSTDQALTFVGGDRYEAGGNIGSKRLRFGFHPNVAEAVVAVHGDGLDGITYTYLNGGGSFKYHHDELPITDGAPVRGEFLAPAITLTTSGSSFSFLDTAGKSVSSRDFVVGMTIAESEWAVVNAGLSNEFVYELTTDSGDGLANGTDLAANVPGAVGDTFTDNSGDVWTYVNSTQTKSQWNAVAGGGGSTTTLTGTDEWEAAISVTPGEFRWSSGVIYRAADVNTDGTDWTTDAVFNPLKWIPIQTITKSTPINASTTLPLEGGRFVTQQTGPITITVPGGFKRAHWEIVDMGTGAITIDSTEGSYQFTDSVTGAQTVTAPWTFPAGGDLTIASLDPDNSAAIPKNYYVYGFAVAASSNWLTITDATTTLTAGDYQIESLTGPLSPTLTLAAGEKIRIWDSRGLAATPNALTLLAPNTVLRYKNPVTGVDFDAADPAGLVMNDPIVFNDIEIVANADGSYSVDFDPQTASSGGSEALAYGLWSMDGTAANVTCTAGSNIVFAGNIKEKYKDAGITFDGVTWTLPAGKYRLSADLNDGTPSVTPQYQFHDGTSLIGSEGQSAGQTANFGGESQAVAYIKSTSPINVTIRCKSAFTLAGSNGNMPSFVEIQQLPTSTVVNPEGLVPEDLHKYSAAMTTGTATASSTTLPLSATQLDSKFDPDGMGVGDTVVIQQAGLYRVDFSSLMSGNIVVSLRVNGVSKAAGFLTATSTSAIQWAGNLVVGDVITLTSGSATTWTSPSLVVQQLPSSTVVMPDALAVEDLKYLSGSYVITNGTTPLVGGNLDLDDTNLSYTGESSWINAANNYVEVDADGVYRLSLYGSSDLAASSNATIKVNDVIVAVGYTSTATYGGAQCERIVSLSAGDQIKFGFSSGTVVARPSFVVQRIATKTVVSPTDVPLTLSTFTPTISGSTTIGTGTGQVFPEQFLVETKTASGITKVEIDGRFSHWDEDDPVTVSLPAGTLTTLFSAVATRESDGHVTPINLNVVDANTFTIDRDNGVNAASGVSVSIVGTK